MIVIVLQELKYIYGRYINLLSEEERNMYVTCSPDDFDFISYSQGLRVSSAHPISMSYFWLWQFVTFPWEYLVIHADYVLCY